jgi:hypothetical protein
MPTLPGRLFWMAAFEPAHFIMERRMMGHMKMLCEQTARSPVALAS